MTELVLNLEGRYLIMTRPPQVLEFFRSARDRDQYELFAGRMASLSRPVRHPGIEDVIGIQRRMREHGIDIVHASIADTLIAAYAVVNHVPVISADHDFDHIAAALEGELRHEYVQPN